MNTYKIQALILSFSLSFCAFSMEQLKEDSTAQLGNIYFRQGYNQEDIELTARGLKNVRDEHFKGIDISPLMLESIIDTLVQSSSQSL